MPAKTTQELFAERDRCIKEALAAQVALTQKETVLKCARYLNLNGYTKAADLLLAQQETGGFGGL